MANWAERAEQERRRLAAEAVNARMGQQAQHREQAKSQDIKDSETLKKLELFHKLGIPRMVREIQRDIWQGYGQVEDTPPKVVNGEAQPFIPPANKRFDKTDLNRRGLIGCALRAHEATEVSVDLRNIWKKENGPYTYQSPGGDTLHGNGPHDVKTGYEVVAAYDGPTNARYSLLSHMNYFPDMEHYALVIAGYKIYASGYQYEGADTQNFAQELRFNNSTEGIQRAKDFADKTFLAYAVSKPVPDFRKLETERMAEKRYYQQNVGKVINTTQSLPRHHRFI